METTVIISGSRTPFGKFLGGLTSVSSVELGALAIKQALTNAQISADLVQYVVMGQVLTAGVGQIPARQSAIKAGIGWNVPALTINKVCLSGIEAVALAADLIAMGKYEVVVAGGQESMTNSPHLLPGFRLGHKFGNAQIVDHLTYDGLYDIYTKTLMGELTETKNQDFNFSREQQDSFAVASHHKAAKAWNNNIFATEVVPVSLTDNKKKQITITQDESIRSETSIDSLAKLRPSFAPNGTITAGNASPINDGACALVLMSKTKAEQLGLTWLAEIGPVGQVAGPDSSLQLQPAQAIQQVAQQLNLAPNSFDLYEINEAFAAVGLATIEALNLTADRVNVNGGAIAIGHPLGVSGARLVLHLALELKRREQKLGVAALCGGGGQGTALAILNSQS